MNLLPFDYIQLTCPVADYIPLQLLYEFIYEPHFRQCIYIWLYVPTVIAHRIYCLQLNTCIVHFWWWTYMQHQYIISTSTYIRTLKGVWWVAQVTKRDSSVSCQSWCFITTYLSLSHRCRPMPSALHFCRSPFSGSRCQQPLGAELNNSFNIESDERKSTKPEVRFRDVILWKGGKCLGMPKLVLLPSRFETRLW